MASDGNCLFRALADQLRGRPQDHGEIREHIVDFMEEHEDDFAPFVEDDEKWVDYVPRMRNEGEWGGQQEICAASRCFRINVVIHQLDSPRLEISFKATAQTVHLSFHGAAHYNSIRAMDDPCREGEPAKAFMALTATPSKSSSQPAAASSSTSSTNSSSSSSASSSPLRPKKTKNQRLQEASKELEPQDGEEDGDTAGVDGPEGGGDGQGNEDDGEGGGEVEEGRDADTTAKVGGQCPCGSGKKWRKCYRKAERQRERFRSGGLGKGQQQGQGQGHGRPSQRADVENDREGAGVLTQKLAAIAL